jgi:hypothetical protein
MLLQFPLALLLASASIQQSQVPPAAPLPDSAGHVVFSATGGSITREGLYTAGATSGSFRVVASTPVVADTSRVTVQAVAPSLPGVGAETPPSTGVPFGPYNAWNATSLKANTEVFTATIGSTNPGNILQRIALARARRMKLILTMTGGAHGNYMTDGVFDIIKWQRRMDAYNTPSIQSAVATGVADGTVIGNSVMDEPHVSGRGDGNTWGPRGTMTKERVDEMCAYVKGMFPTMPVGVVHPHKAFQPERSYKVCDFLVDQYSARQGDVGEFRDEGLSLARRDGLAIVFSLNILNGGLQAARGGSWDCSLERTGGRGTHAPNCRMTPDQVREWGRLLGSSGCALMMWQYDDAFMSQPDNQRAFADLARELASMPAKACRRS